MTTTQDSSCSFRYLDETFCDRRPLYDDKHCVFHSEVPDKGSAFWPAWEEQVADKDWKCQGYRFPGDLDLSKQGLVDADFRDAQFSGDASFLGATFSGDAYFWRATFSGGAYFWRATFSGDASFGDATFAGDAHFMRATFSGVAYFGDATFEKPVSWENTKFQQSSFYDVPWPEYTIFDKVDFGVSSFEKSDLRHVTFRRRCHLGDVSLAEAYFPAAAEYDQVTWGSLPGDQARPVIREEREARQRNTKEAYETAARVYRELRRSYEEHKNFLAANHFAYGELEMRRLAVGRGSSPQQRWQAWWGSLRRNLLSLEALYLHTSAYGQSWPRASLWLAAIVLLFPVGYAATGLDLGAGPFALCGLWEGLNPAAYGELLVFSLRTAALLPEPPGATLSSGAQFLQVLERVLSPILATLLIIAVRRRFRR